jgi:hypothetical protein
MVHNELFLIKSVEEKLETLFDNGNIVFLGVGNGDTEMAIVDVLMKSHIDSLTISGVDINEDFLSLFENSLDIREKEFQDLDLVLTKIIKNFAELNNPSIDFKEQGSPKTVCILGNTIGNYNDTNDIVKCIDRITFKNDLVLVSYQLNTHFDLTYEKYINNPMFMDFITHYLNIRKKDYSKYIEWKKNANNWAIEAWYDDVQIFRSRKFPKDEMKELFAEYNMTRVFHTTDSYDNLCMEIYKKG